VAASLVRARNCCCSMGGLTMVTGSVVERQSVREQVGAEMKYLLFALRYVLTGIVARLFVLLLAS